MKISNITPEIAELNKVTENSYTLDYGIIKKGTSTHITLQLEDYTKELKAKVSCGGCTKAKIENNQLKIWYNSSLYGRINKYVYLFEGHTKTDIKLTGNII